MNPKPLEDRGCRESDTRAAIRKRFVQVGTFLVILAATLFLSAGRLDWAAAWAYLGVYAVSIPITAAITLRKCRELIVERSRIREGTKGWDLLIAFPAMLLLFPATLAVAGLDVRLAWTGHVLVASQIIAFVVVAAGYALFIWAMVSNPFFAGTVRIQKERGHRVVSAGPYRYVRHPGYAGFVMLGLATPLLLGSLWALIPAGLGTLLMILRTALEDKTLLAELDGYQDYAARVRCRLVPGLW